MLDVRWILRKVLRLPSEVACLILDLSEYWAHSFILRNGKIVAKWLHEGYISVKLNSKGPGSVRRMVFTTKSREDAPLQALFAHMELPGYSYTELLHQVPTRYSDDSWLEVAIVPTETPPTSRPSPKPRLIQRNAQAKSPVSPSRIHVNTWEYKDHADWMNEIHPGDLISVDTQAGWPRKNVVDFVRMDIYCAW